MDSILKWEYITVDSRPGRNEELQILGNQGWEAFACNNGEILLKRPCGEISITKRISQEQERNSVSYDGYER